MKLTPYLHSGVHVVVDVIVLQHPVAVVIEIHAHLTQEVDSRETITTWMRKERTHLWYRVPFIEPQRTGRTHERACVPAYLFAAVDAVASQDWRAARGHPHPRQRVAVDLVLLDHPLALLVLRRQRDTRPFNVSRCGVSPGRGRAQGARLSAPGFVV